MTEKLPLSATQQQFVAWLATPKSVRSSRTIAEYSQESGVPERTLYRWKRNPKIMGGVVLLMQELLGDDLPEIYGALAREAIKGSFQHIKLALEVCGEYTKGKVLIHATTPVPGPVGLLKDRLAAMGRITRLIGKEVS